METMYLLLRIAVTIGIAVLVGQWIAITDNSIEFIARQAPRVEVRTIEICNGVTIQETIQTTEVRR